MPNNDTDYFLRPEAGPVPYRKLQKRAKAALKLIVQALNAAVASAEAAADSEGGGRVPSYAIDRHRASRLFFVSGEPGSGKSTLYVTLRAMLSKDKRYSEYSKEYDGEDLERLKDNVRWLEPIDLEVVGDKDENLLAAVLVRLIRALDESKSGFSKDCGEAIKKLDQLAADIGMAWDSNLRARASALDPDSYSMEVMRAQQARLGVNERLREALDKLAKHNCCGCDDSTLFVLPVDDLYLKPDASLQLLRLLRMISVPRLFFLVMGDITTVEALFTEKALADWTGVAGAEVFQTLPDRLSDALARARELRARFLRKLLPPGQRAEIQPMDWDEAMKFRPERSDDIAEAEALGTWLAQVELDRPWTPTNETNSPSTQTKYQGNLFNFLTCRPLDDLWALEELKNVVKEDENLKGSKKKSREVYTGLQLLDATPREVMDLWSALQELIKEEKIRKNKSGQSQDGNSERTSSQDSGEEGSDSKIPLLTLVLEFAMLSIDEQNFLNEKQQSAVLNGVLPTRRYNTPDIYLEMNRLCLEPESSDWKAISPGEVWVRKHSPWKLKPNASPKGNGTDLSSESRTEENPGEFNKLPPRQTAWIVLLHDLAWMWRHGSLKENLVTSLRQELTNKLSEPIDLDAQGEPSNDVPGWAIIREDATYKSLQMPEFETVRALDCFLRVWNRGLELQFQELEKEEQLKSEEKARLLVKLLWDLAGWTVIKDQYDAFARNDDKWFEEVLRTNTEPTSKQKSKTNAAPNAEDHWKLELAKFRGIPKIKGYLRRLSELEKIEKPKEDNKDRPTVVENNLDFEDWLKKSTEGSFKTTNSTNPARPARKTARKKR